MKSTSTQPESILSKSYTSAVLSVAVALTMFTSAGQANAELTTSSTGNNQVKRVPVALNASNQQSSQPMSIDSLSGVTITEGKSTSPVIEAQRLKPFNPNESIDPLVKGKIPVPVEQENETKKDTVKKTAKTTKATTKTTHSTKVAKTSTTKKQTKNTATSNSKSNSVNTTTQKPASKYNQTADTTAIKNIESKNGKTFITLDLNDYAKTVNSSQWSKGMKQNSAMTVKLQALLDWNHASPGPIDGGWGMNSVKALKNFQTMKGLPVTGRMNQATWNAMIKNNKDTQPVLVKYRISANDVNSIFIPTPSGSEAKSKLKGLYYQNIYEMLAERFHMNVNYLKRLNKKKKFVEGDVITVFNSASNLNQRITRVVANKADETLYAYNGDKLIATYPTTVGSTNTPSPHGTFKIVNKVKMPWYRATVGDENDENKQTFMLPPGPNNPVGLVWMGLSKPSFGLHGSPIPEGISRQASHGCIRLTNWDVLEVYANIKKGAVVELK